LFANDCALTVVQNLICSLAWMNFHQHAADLDL
jgi:hypothetical protein